MNLEKSHISVCICTYKRQTLLNNLLEHLATQRTDTLFSYSIIVIDNDYMLSAMQVVTALRDTYPVRLEYYSEPIQNISLARNTALKHANATHIAFIDDDEFPSNNWLITLFNALNTLNADGIQGRVIPYYHEHAPQWVIRGGFYNKPEYTTGHVLEWRQGVTANLLFKQKLVENNDNRFDPAFGSGGEDQDFFRRAIIKGYCFKYCHEAVVYEYIPLIRCRRSFLLRRALLRGKLAVLRPTFNVVSILKSLIASVLYTTSLPISLLLGQHIFMTFLIKDCDHIGKLLAFYKVQFIKDRYITE